MIDFYSTSGDVIGYVTSGDAANAINGVVYNSAFNGNPGNRVGVAKHTNGSYYVVKIVSAVKSGNNWNFSGAVDAVAVNFKPSVAASAQSVIQQATTAIANTVQSVTGNATLGDKINSLPWYLVGAAGLGVLFLMVSSRQNEYRH